jgi:hypothetical protein
MVTLDGRLGSFFSTWPPGTPPGTRTLPIDSIDSQSKGCAGGGFVLRVCIRKANQASGKAALY